MQNNRRLATPPQSRSSNNFSSPRSYTSSSDNSHGRTQDLSRTESGTSHTHYENADQSPSPKVLMDEYTREAATGVGNGQETGPRTLRMSRGFTSNDPVTMHLLVEMAVSDSQHFTLLSVEELERLNKELISLNLRVESGRRKLYLETKVRNTTQSLRRLYPKKGKGDNPDSPTSRRKSLLGGFRNSNESGRAENSNTTEEDLIASTRKCEELAQDLWRLERRLAELHDTKLKHIAGVLQMNRQMQMQNGRNRGDGSFDDSSLIPSDLSNYVDGIMDIPKRRTILERDLSRRNEAMIETERRLQNLHDQVWNLVKVTDPESRMEVALVSERVPNGIEIPSTAITDQLGNLEYGLQRLKDTVVASANMSATNTTKGKLQSLNTALYGIISNSGMRGQPRYPSPPEDGASPEVELTYLEDGLYTVKELHAELMRFLQESHVKDQSHDRHAQHTNSVLIGLWEILASNDEETRQKEQKLKGVSDGGSDKDLDDGSSEEVPRLDQSFTLQAFSTKVQRLCKRATLLSEKQMVLNNQLREDRDMNRRATSVKAAERQNLIEKLQEAHNQHLVGQRALQDTQSQLASAKTRLDQALYEIDDIKRQEAFNSEQLVAERQARRASEENLLTQLNTKLALIATLEQAAASHSADLRSARNAHDDAEASLFDQVTRLEQTIASYAAELESSRSTHRDTELSLSTQIAAGEQAAATHTFDLESSHSAHRDVEASLSIQIATLEQAVATHTADLESSRSAHRDTEASLSTHITMLEQATATHAADLESSRSAHHDAQASLSTQIATLEQAIANHADDLERSRSAHRDSEASLSTVRGQLSKQETDIGNLQASESATAARLVAAETCLQETAAALQEKSAEIAKADTERQDLEAEVVRLQTELTIARAELDGAYGTRAQRAAEVASNPEVKKGLEDMRVQRDEIESKLQQALDEKGEAQTRAETLQRELKELITEYEGLVKSGIEAEREREDVEAVADTLREQVEALEVRLSEERVRTMGRRSSMLSNGLVATNGVNAASQRGLDGVGADEGRGRIGEMTSISVMRSEFKKMMREARAEHFRDMKAEQDERRKLEALVRFLRKEKTHSASSSASSSAAPAALGKIALTRSVAAL